MRNLIDIERKTVDIDAVIDSFPDGTSIKAIESNDEDVLIICVSIFRHSKKIESTRILSWSYLVQHKDPEEFIFFIFHGLREEIKQGIRSVGIVRTGSES